uniref:Uncharacterized protein n=1 Tax=Anguilla anguilla TaxID=7936 RepID=A0A0E9TC06_ANGAN
MKDVCVYVTFPIIPRIFYYFPLHFPLIFQK